MEKLIKAAEELNKVMGLDPEIPTSEKGLKKQISAEPKRFKGMNAEKALKEQLKEASEYIDPDKDSFSNATIQVLRTLGVWLEDDEAEEAPEPEEETPVELEEETPELEEDTPDDIPALEDIIGNAAKRKDLTEIAKTNEEFKSLLPSITRYKTTEDLREIMLAILTGEKGKEVEPEPAIEKSEPKQIISKKQKKSKMTRPQAVAQAIQENPKTLDDCSELANEIYVKHGGVSNVKKMKADITYILCVLKTFNIKTSF